MNETVDLFNVLACETFLTFESKELSFLPTRIERAKAMQMSVVLNDPKSSTSTQR